MSQVDIEGSKPRPPGSKPELRTEEPEEIAFIFKLVRLPKPSDSTEQIPPSVEEKILLEPVITNILKQRPETQKLIADGDTTWIQLVPIHLLDQTTKKPRTGLGGMVKNVFTDRKYDSKNSAIGPWGHDDYAAVIHFAVTEDIVITPEGEEPQPAKQEHGWALFVMSGKDAVALGNECLKDPQALFEYLTELGMVSEDEQLQLSTGEPASIELGNRLVVLSNGHLQGNIPNNVFSKTTF